jgi:hypothetical protein
MGGAQDRDVRSRPGTGAKGGGRSDAVLGVQDVERVDACDETVGEQVDRGEHPPLERGARPLRAAQHDVRDVRRAVEARRGIPERDDVHRVAGAVERFGETERVHVPAPRRRRVAHESDP